ncbi:MAG: hypothetical protein ABJN11_13895 [Lentilitoribacter sp.]
MSMLAESNENTIAESYRLEMSSGVSSEFGKVDVKVLDALEESAKEEEAKKQKAEEMAKKADAKKAKANGGAKTEMADKEPTPEKKPHPLQDKIADLSSSNPLTVKCFGTKPYVAVTNSTKDFDRIKGGVVQKLVEERDFSDELTSVESIVARMWLARERALQAEGGQTHLAAIGNYLIAAQRTLKDAHEYHGDEGLEWAKTLLHTRADKRVIEQIKIRVPSKRYTRKLNQKMQLLINQPEDFIPCTVRAEQQFGGQMAAQLSQ